MTTCTGVTRRGTRCKLKPLENEEYCRFHLSQKTDHPPQKNTGQFIYSIVKSRNELLILLVVFVLALLMSPFLSEIIHIPSSIVVALFSAVSQTIAALIGFLFVMGIFFMQLISQEKNNAYGSFKAEVKELFNLSRDCPTSVNLQDEFLDVVESLGYENLTNVVYNPPDWDVLVSLAEKSVELRDSEKILDTQAKIFLRRVLSSAVAIEEAYNRLSHARLGHIVISVEFVVLHKLAILLTASLLCLVLFGSIDIQDIFPDFSFPTITTFMVGLILVFVELLTNINRMVREFQSIWPGSPD